MFLRKGNMMRTTQSNNKSGKRGVYFKKDQGVWIAFYKPKNEKRIYRKFDSFEDAANERDILEKQYQNINLDKFDLQEIPNYDGRYSATKCGKIYSHVKGNFLNPSLGMTGRKIGDGYMYVCILENNTPTTKSVHRLIAKTFLKNPSNKPTVNHKNGNKKDNTISNLEWASYSENMIHAYANGLNGTKNTSREVA